MAKSLISKIIASHQRPTERTKEVVKYLFCHQELIRIASVVMSGYDPDKHFFIDPGDQIQDYFEQFLEIYKSLSNDSNVLKLPLFDFRGFTLAERNIGLWNRLTYFEEELQLVQMYVPYDSYVPDNELRVMAFELRNMLVEFGKFKEEEIKRLQTKKNLLTISFDDSRSTITVNSKNYDASLNKIPFIFLRTLVRRNGLIASYKVLADEMKINSNTKNSSNSSVARAVQDVKNKLLKPKLKSIGIPDREIRLIMQSIRSQAGAGYKFTSTLP